MLKNKYQKMNQSEKKKIKELYYATKDGKTMKQRLIRILMFAIICFGYSFYLVIDWYLNKTGSVFLILSITVFVAAIIFLIGYIKIKGKVLNNFAIKIK